MPTVSQATKQLIDIHTQAQSNKTAAQEGYSNAQEQYAHRCAELSIEMGEKFAEVPDGLQKDAKYKSLASKTRCWGHPDVRSKVETIFNQGRKVNDGGSVYNAAYAIASQVKKGLSPTAAANAVKAAKADKVAAAETMDGQIKAAKASILNRMRKVNKGFTKEHLADVYAELDKLASVDIAEPVATPEPVVPAPEDVSVTAAMPPATPAASEADELGTLLSNMLANGTPPKEAAETVMYLRQH